MELGRTDITPASMERVMSSGIPFFEKLSSVNMLSAMFMLKIPDGSYSLRTMFPLTVDLGISESTGKPESLVTGVLEITQDITDDYDSVVRFQWLILATCLGSSTILFAMGLSWLLGMRNIPKMFLAALAVTALIYAVFVWGLDVMPPRGVGPIYEFSAWLEYLL